MERDRPRASLRPLLTIVCLLLFLALGTAACGNGSVNAQPSGTPSSTAKQNASPTVTGTTVVTPKSCGTISHLGVGPASSQSASAGKSTPQSAANCFWQAYQACNAASLTVVTSSIDTSVTRTFQIQKVGGNCSIRDTVQARVLPRPPHITGKYTCSTMSKQTAALQFLHCQGDGTITVSLLNAH